MHNAETVLIYSKDLGGPFFQLISAKSCFSMFQTANAAMAPRIRVTTLGT